MDTRADTIRNERRRRDLSQYELAKKAGLHPATISLAERGTRISQETAEKIAAALELRVEELCP